MLQQQITIINKLGLHARAAAKLVSRAARFHSQIELARHNQIANCKSIMGVLTLGAAKGTVLDLRVSGEDEVEALDAIVSLINGRFEEKE